MLAWRADHDYGVLELGASAVGEIARLASLARPHIAVITRIAEAHLAGFGSRAAVATGKAELLEALPAEGWAVLNGDDPTIRRVAGRRKHRITWVGRGADNDLTATHVRSSNGQLEFRVDGQFYTVPVWGRHHLTGALIAIAIGRSWGIAPAEIAESLVGFRSPAMRCEVSALGDASLINDAYNSNPTAMRTALELLREFDNPGRRIVICGDMRELGDESARLHRNLGSEVVQVCGADVLIACGEYASDVVAGARAAGMPHARSVACQLPEEAAAHASQVLSAGDVVLVKGSRAVALERCIQGLQQITSAGSYRRAA
jgi:UDP-N-acetylmuramoyl-tripeptide--D-alanyl-D-alanine ligase